MAFLQVEFFSNVLKVASTVKVILPEKSMGIGVTAGGREDRLPLRREARGGEAWRKPAAE